MPLAIAQGTFSVSFSDSRIESLEVTTTLTPAEIRRIRRDSRARGKALETLGHAAEYLIDSRMFLIELPYTKAEEEAVQTLMLLNRQIFDEHPKVVAPQSRIRAYMRSLISFPPR